MSTEPARETLRARWYRWSGPGALSDSRGELIDEGGVALIADAHLERLRDRLTPTSGPTGQYWPRHRPMLYVESEPEPAGQPIEPHSSEPAVDAPAPKPVRRRPTR